MITWTDYQAWLGDLAAGPPPPAPAPALAVLVTDSRTIGEGQWFVPITGEAFDGHKFIEAAVRQGASGFFYDIARRQELPAAVLAKGWAVRDPLAAFQHAAAGWRATLKNLKVVALTGSVGKTTTKEMLAAMLRHAGPTFATQASFNNEIGVPKTLQCLSPGHRFAALEFGARMPGNIRFLCGLATPNVVGLVNVGVAHLGVFGSPAALLATKLEIFRDSPNDAVQVAFADDPRIVAGARATGKPTLTFGADAGADVRLSGVDWLAGGAMEVRLTLAGRSLAARLAVAHTAFGLNAAAAAALALAAGVPDASIAAGLSGFRGLKGRYQVHQLGRLTLVDDTYNANPDSMRAGLATVARTFPGQRLVLVLGDMLELGADSAAEHRRIGAELIVPLAPALLVTVGGDARQLAAGAIAAGLPAAAVRSYDDVAELLRGPALDGAGGVIYAKASNGLKLSLLIDRLLGGAREDG